MKLNKLLLIGGMAIGSNMAMLAQLSYPITHTDNVVDEYFGNKVADPYRWLEDDLSAETAQWVNEQNVVTHDYLSKIPFRNEMKSRLTDLANYAR